MDADNLKKARAISWAEYQYQNGYGAEPALVELSDGHYVSHPMVGEKKRVFWGPWEKTESPKIPNFQSRSSKEDIKNWINQ